jgi:hypothetical protein
MSSGDMNIPFSKLVLAVFLTVAALLSSCYHDADLSFVPPKPTQDPNIRCSQDTVYFQNTVFPVILSNCAKSGCHDQSSQKGDLALDNYFSIYNLIVPFSPENSKLYIKLYSNSEGRMPPDAPLTMNQKSIIYWWIRQGGYNNRCDSVGCDTTNVTYTSTMQPILETWCTGCHGGSNPSNGLRLDSYNYAVACANSGQLMPAIRHDAGYVPMPGSGGKLSDCEITQFQIWINKGMPQ